MQKHLQLSLVILLVLLFSIFRVQAQSIDQDLLNSAARRSPVVASILELPLEKPSEQIRAIFTLLDLDEREVATALWNNFPRTELNIEIQAALVAEFGTARFLSFARLSGQEFEGAREFVKSCINSAVQASRDPERIQQLIQQLSDPSEEIRFSARVDLAATSHVGAAACLESLAKTTNKSTRKNLLLSLIDLRPEADPLLLAVLADGHGTVRRDVIELIGHVRLLEAVPWLAAIVSGTETDNSVIIAAQDALHRMNLSLPSIAETRRMIHKEIGRMESGVSIHPRYGSLENNWWNFDNRSGEITSQAYTSEIIQLLAAERLAKLFTLLPNPSTEEQDLAKIYAFQAAKKIGNEPTEELLLVIEKTSTQGLSHALIRALQNDSSAAALMIIDLLGNRADYSALYSTDGRPSALAMAMSQGDINLRFAALEAIMKISPQDSFSGSSRVPELLWSFALGAGTPQAITASSNVGVAHDWAGQLRGLGYEAIATMSGNEALSQAAKATRLQVLFLDSDINRPELREVIYQLRCYTPTSELPIAVLCSLENLSRAKSLATEDSHTIAMPRPHSEESLNHILNEMKQLSAFNTSKERLERAKMALIWIADLLESGSPYDELLRDSKQISETLYIPELFDESLRVLASLGTAHSQSLILDLASNQIQSIEHRRAAVNALESSLKRVGKLLTHQEILQQYDRYNASAAADVETQEVLGQILDLLEEK